MVLPNRLRRMNFIFIFTVYYLYICAVVFAQNCMHTYILLCIYSFSYHNSEGTCGSEQNTRIRKYIAAGWSNKTMLLFSRA